MEKTGGRDFFVKVVIPGGVFLEDTAERVSVLGYDGYMGVGAGHQPFVVMTRAGLLTIMQKGNAVVHQLFVEHGVADAGGDFLLLLVEGAVSIDSLNESDLEKEWIQLKGQYEQAQGDDKAPFLAKMQHARAQLDARLTYRMYARK